MSELPRSDTRRKIDDPDVTWFDASTSIAVHHVRLRPIDQASSTARAQLDLFRRQFRLSYPVLGL